MIRLKITVILIVLKNDNERLQTSHATSLALKDLCSNWSNLFSCVSIETSPLAADSSDGVREHSCKGYFNFIMLIRFHLNVLLLFEVVSLVWGKLAVQIHRMVSLLNCLRRLVRLGTRKRREDETTNTKTICIHTSILCWSPNTVKHMGSLLFC